jgi:hypothetical protein
MTNTKYIKMEENTREAENTLAEIKAIRQNNH